MEEDLDEIMDGEEIIINVARRSGRLGGDLNIVNVASRSLGPDVDAKEEVVEEEEAKEADEQ